MAAVFSTATSFDTSAAWLEVSGASTMTKTVSVISNSDRAFIIQVVGSDSNSRNVSSATLGGQSLSRIGYIAYPSNIYTDVWGIMNPPSGNQSLTVNFTGTTTAWMIAMQFYNTSGWRSYTFDTEGSSATPDIVAMSVLEDDLVVCAFDKFLDLDTLTTGQSLIYSANRNALVARSAYTVATSTGLERFAYSTSTSDKYSGICFMLKPLTETKFAYIIQNQEATSNDAHVRSDAPTTNYAVNSDLFVGEANDGTGSQRVSLIKFDLSSVPTTGVKITKVFLSLYMFGNKSSNNKTMYLYRCLRNWTESGVTWNTYDGTNSWTTGGAMGAGTDIDTTTPHSSRAFTSGEALGGKLFDISITEFKKFLDSTYSNYGYVIAYSPGTQLNDQYDFATGNSIYPFRYPVLTVEYELLKAKGSHASWWD